MAERGASMRRVLMTELTERLKALTPMRGAADPDESTQAAAWLLGDRSSFVTGRVLRGQGGARA
ncbi:SDR family oxidoreductase [Streptomyces sp. NPDC058257]|uniref:SDR family oxidoreductase n=1 Tax=Streptomyces sp. NPDC058257 TaxID=3346409 RepID=UPI0036F104F5